MANYSCLHTRYQLGQKVEHYVETAIYGEASFYHALGYSVIHWHGSEIPSVSSHKMLVEQMGQGNFEPHW